MRFIETKKSKSDSEKEIYVFSVGMEEARMLQSAMQNVYVSIPYNQMLLKQAKARALNMYKVLSSITNKP